MEERTGMTLRRYSHRGRCGRRYPVVLGVMTEHPGGRGCYSRRSPDGGETTARRGAGPPAKLARRTADEHVVG